MRHLSNPRSIQGSPTWVPLRLQALLPTSVGSSRMKPRSGQRWSSRRASSRTEPRVGDPLFELGQQAVDALLGDGNGGGIVARAQRVEEAVARARVEMDRDI